MVKAFEFHNRVLENVINLIPFKRWLFKLRDVSTRGIGNDPDDVEEFE